MPKLIKKNNMKKYIAFCIISSLFICETFSQNTGYMGKHFFLNAEANFSPAYVIQILMVFIIKQPRLFCFQFYFNLREAIVWKKGTVGVGYNFLLLLY